MNLTRLFSHSLLLPQCFVKYLPGAPGSQAFSGGLYSGWLPAAFRCIPCHCHDCGVTDSSCIPCLDALIPPLGSRCFFLLMAPAVLYQFQDLFFSVILHIASQLTHRIRSGFAPAHRAGTHPVGIHMTLFSVPFFSCLWM